MPGRERPLVVVCIDGCEPDYTIAGDGGGRRCRGSRGAGEAAPTCCADCVVPSFTNPNNLSIVTGAPPSVHGICGNYFYDREADAEVMMNDPKYLRADTILAAFSRRRRQARGGHRQGQAAQAARPRA